MTTTLDLAISQIAYDSLKPTVKKALEEHLEAGETIRVIIPGSFGQAIIGADTRVFVCKPGFMAGATSGGEVTSWSYQDLFGVQADRGLVNSCVVLQAPGQFGMKTSYWGTDTDDASRAPNAIPVGRDWATVNDGVARLRRLIDEAHHRPSSAPAAVSGQAGHPSPLRLP